MISDMVLQGATIHTSQGLLMQLQPRCRQGQKQTLCQVMDAERETACVEEELVAMSSKI